MRTKYKTMAQIFSNRRQGIRTAILFTGLSFLFLQGARAQSAQYIYFVPLPETQIHNTFRVLYTSTGTTYHSVISIVPSVSNTIIYYDQWEDGYETNLSTPVQSSTWIFGDGNASNNGGYPDAVVAGKPIILQNDLVVPNSASIIKADGGDKIACSKSLSCARSSWATNPGTVLADAVEFLNTQAFGTSFEIPIGQNTSSGGMFNLTALHVQASQNATQINIVKDPAFPLVVTTATINQGESYQVNGGIMQGATVTSNKPVQVNLITGLPGATYESRWYYIYPLALWDAGYYSPVSTAISTAESHVFLYNPTASPLSVTVHTNANLAGAVVSVPSKGTYRYIMPSGSSAHFDNPSVKFFAVGATDADATNTTWDWGYTLVPENYLTTSFYVGWGIGAYNSPTQNGNPVWVGSSSLTKTTIVYVDVDGNPATGALTDANGNKFDYTVSIAPMASSRLYDNVDNDQTGMHVYTLDGTEIIGAWGEDASKAGAGTPFLDVGTTIAPDPVLRIWKTAVLVTDVNTNGKADVDDVIEWTVNVYNQTLQSFAYVILKDNLDSHLTYVAGTTKFNGVPLPDDVSPASPFPIDESGFNINPLSTGAKDIVTFRTTVYLLSGITSVPNSVTATNNFGEVFLANASVPANVAGVTTCVEEFTSTANGTATVAYTENATIYVRVTDGDQNLNSGAVDQVRVTLYNSGTFDSEILILNETGNNTGIFTGSIPSSNSLGAGADNGILYTLAGNSVLATYVDQLYGGTCTANATFALPSNTKQLYLNETPAATMDRTIPIGGSPTNSIVMGSGAGGAVAHAVTSSGFFNTARATFTVSHGTVAGTNRIMIVGISYNDPADAINVTGVTYGTQTLSQLGIRLKNASGSKPTVDIWYIAAPTVGTANVTVTWSGNVGAGVVGVSTYTNVNQTSPFGTAVTATGNSTAPSVTVTSATNDLVIDVIGEGDNSNQMGVGANQTERWNREANFSGSSTWDHTGGGSSEAGAASVTMSWTENVSIRWAIKAVPLNPASLPGNPTATFTQDPAMCSALTIPAGSAISANLYLSIVSGSMPSTPSITATIKYGTTTFGNLNTASWNSGTGILTLSGTSSATTIPITDPVVLTVTTAQAAVTFQIRYDAASYPSKINLPTPDVINMGTLSVYSASYASGGGTLVTGATNGQTVYARTTVTDPFGTYDIDPPSSTPALVITNPPGFGTTNVTMTQVGTVTCGKIYEYAWSTPAAQGTYTLTATSKEGSENTISSTKATSFVVTFTDTGTPCNITFINQSSSPYSVVTFYTGGSLICLEVNDMDRNTNPLNAETISATVSTSGDSESITLTETGVNTGKFTGCVASSTTLGVGNNNNTLLAPAGSSLTGTFDDLVNAPDVCTANAVILQPAPDIITMAKTLVSPADGFALIGDLVTWQIVITNPGTTNLTVTSLIDTYNSTCLQYSSATPAPSSTTSGSLTWNNAALSGPINSGQNRVILVNFTVLAACGATNNTVNLTGTGTGAVSVGPVVSTVNLINAQLNILKTRTSPADPIYATISPVTQVSYNIHITNSGNTIVETIPLLDTYSSTNLVFSSSSITPSSSGGGQIIWDNIIPGVAQLAVGASMDVTVTFNVIAGNYPFPVSNNAATGFAAVDVYGKSIPIVSS
ncbi:MAG: hypothetical protein NTV01_10425, partial [Bacteroidia bacterium]|nr:hypothetical protein [Bacteroidia bacterium]